MCAAEVVPVRPPAVFVRDAGVVLLAPPVAAVWEVEVVLGCVLVVLGCDVVVAVVCVVVVVVACPAVVGPCAAVVVPDFDAPAAAGLAAGLAGAAALGAGAAGFLSALSAGQTRSAKASGAAKYLALKDLQIAGMFI